MSFWLLAALAKDGRLVFTEAGGVAIGAFEHNFGVA